MANAPRPDRPEAPPSPRESVVAAPALRERSSLPKRFQRIAIAVGLWTLFGILWATPSMLDVDRRRDGQSLWDAADHVIVFYWAWAIVTPLVLLIARRAAARSPARWQTVGYVAAWAPLVMLAQGLVYYGLEALLRITPVPGLDELWYHFRRHGGGDLATYLTIVGMSLLVDASRRAREGERAAAELLRWQLQPHFLFNSLNTVSTLVLQKNTDGAERAIELISGYLRDALVQRPDSMVPLREELAMVERYVAIERLRFGDALRMETTASGDALGARLPVALLQPLVENAIRHGSRPGAAGATIAVTAALVGGRLHVSIADPGQGISSTVPFADGIPAGFGLRYVRERLGQHFGANAKVEVVTVATSTVVELDLPQSV